MAQVARPNILFILIDDLGWRDLGCYGSSFYETPCLDRLAQQGMRFTRAYASAPVCSPTRASILTGKYPARVGITQWIGGQIHGRLRDVPYLHYLPLEETSLAAALREGGYQTWHIGKWHLGDGPFYPEHHGFDINLGGCEMGRPHTYFAPYAIPTLPEGPEGEYLTDRLTDEAIRLIGQRDPQRPFFLNLWHYAVHTPVEAPPHLIEKYQRKAQRLGLDRIEPIVEGEIMGRLPPPGQTLRVQRRIIQSDVAYAAMLENLDHNIGRLLDALRQHGLDDNTLVLFTSDNGGLSTSEGSPTCNHPLAEGKGWSEEGGTRICQIVRWPGQIRRGAVCDVPVTSTDFYPTLLEAAGLPPRPDQHVDGVSLLSLLRETGTLDREAIFWHYPHYSNQGGTPAAAVVSGPWKLIQWFETGRTALFNLEQDISETTDLSRIHPAIHDRLLALLKRWQREVEANIPAPNPEYTEHRILPRVPNNAHE